MTIKKIYTLDTGTYLTRRNTPKGFVDDCSHMGDCSKDVNKYLHRFNVPDRSKLAKYLHSTGGWEKEELINHTDNVARFLWLIARDIKEQGMFYYGT